MPPEDFPAYRARLHQRLGVVAEVLLPGASITPRDDADVLGLLDPLARSVQRDPGGGRLWILFAAVAGAFPTPGQHERLRRRLALVEESQAASEVLAGTLEAAAGAGDWNRPIRVVREVTVVDVNFCAKYVHNTGIQRVVREVMPHLVRLGGDGMQLVAWSRRSGITRTLTALERQRVIDWRALGAGTALDQPGQPDELIVPWNCRVFLPEVPESALCERLAALAEFSNNSVVAIGYDTIPIGSADLVTSSESERFARYLTVLKHVDGIVAISQSVAREFSGYSNALVAQGLRGPKIECVTLAADPPKPSREDADQANDDRLPLILAVGSHEPRKNQDAVLFAVTSLLSSGLKFRTVFVGGGDRRRTLPFDRALQRLRKERGWQIESRRGMKDRELFQLYRDARFSAFVSLHEGYGLPVVESLALGTPVLTSDYGSLAEIASGGGCVTTDPRDDAHIIEKMRTLLEDDDLILRLQAEAAARPVRTWETYATELLVAAGLGGQA